VLPPAFLGASSFEVRLADAARKPHFPSCGGADLPWVFLDLPPPPLSLTDDSQPAPFDASVHPLRVSLIEFAIDYSLSGLGREGPRAVPSPIPLFLATVPYSGFPPAFSGVS